MTECYNCTADKQTLIKEGLRKIVIQPYKSQANYENYSFKMINLTNKINYNNYERQLL